MLQMPGAYEEWQSLIARAFLQPHAGPTLLFIDSDELRRLKPGTAAEEDLAAAVREVLSLQSGRGIFGPLTHKLMLWRQGRGQDAPPVLPMLAISVLAATRMRSDADAHSTNYYLRLAQALLPGGSAAEVGDLRGVLRGGAFQTVADMWRALDQWIRNQGGRVGISTIREHPYLPYIGYPLSQALVREADRVRLTRFFAAMRFRNDLPGAEPVLRALDVWTSAPQNRLGDSFMRALTDAETRPLVGDVVCTLASAWDGRVLASDGQPRIPIKLGLDLECWTTRWLFEAVPGAPEVIGLSAAADPVTLTHVPGLTYYAGTGAPAVSGEAVLHGFRLRGPGFSAEFPASPIVLCRTDEQTGAWSSVSSLKPFEEHLVAVSAAEEHALRAALERAAAPGWVQETQRRGALLRGYSLFSGVRFLDGEKLAEALIQLPALRRLGLTPPLIPRMQLAGGLPIAKALSRSSYLCGGEPDLLIPTTLGLHMVDVELDGIVATVPANGFPFPLHPFLHGGAGRHVVKAEGQQLDFTTLEEDPDPAPPEGTGTIAWTAAGRLAGPGDVVTIRGALVAQLADRPHSALARRGRDESWLLLDGGRAVPVAEPEPPSFLKAAGLEVELPQFEVAVPADCRWLAQRRGSRWHLIGTAPGDTQCDLDIDVLSAWRRAGIDSNAAQLWKVQLAMAGNRS